MSNLTNDSDSASAEFSWGNGIIGAVLYILVLITFFGNLIVLVAVYKEKSLQTAFNFFIVNLAITDMAVGATAMSFYATDKMLGYWPFGRILCGIWIFFDYGMTFASVFTLVAISCDRFWSVFWSLSYRSVNKKKKSLIMITIVWVSMLLLWIPPLILDRLKNEDAPDFCMWNPALNKEFVIVIAIVGHHGPCAAMLFFYFRVFFYLRARIKLRPTKKKTNKVSPMSISVTANETGNVPVAADHSKEDYGPPTETRETNISPPTASATTSAVAEEQTKDSSGDAKDSHNIPAQQPPSTLNAVSLMEQVQTKAKDSQAPQKMAFLQVPGKKSGPKSKEAKPSAEDKRASREMRVFVTLTYIIAGYLVCWVPFHVVFDVSAISPELVPPVIFDITFWLTYINSTINPFLYNFSSPEFRTAFRRIIWSSKPGGSTATWQRTQSV